jgi:drug/metabolite transporter (DMT)-like permease
MTDRKDRLDLLAIAVMTGLCALWGLNQVTVKVANAGISPVAYLDAADLLARDEAMGTMIGLVAAFLGIGVAFAEAVRLPSPREMVGDIMAFAAIFWGATTVVVKATRLAQLSAEKTLFYQLAGSAVVLTLLSAALGEPGVFAPTSLVLAAFFFQLVVVAFASYLCWFWLVMRYPAFRLSAFAFLTPLFGILAGALLLGEPVTLSLAVAMALVGAGIYLVNHAAPAAARPASSVAVLNSGD